ncbi:MAG: hypothetical protein AAB481_01105 [Patescibacteria group bacterium]
MEDEQRTSLVAALAEAYVSMPDKNLLAAYQRSIEPLLEGISAEDKLALADEFRQTTVYGAEEHSLAGLAFYLAPQVGGS